MLNTLEGLLNTHYPFNSELKDIPKSCCNGVTIKVWDFDKIKDEFYSKIAAGTKLKSVDALYFYQKWEEIYLIEMKSFDIGGALTYEQFINYHFSPTQLPCKIIDSCLILLGIVGYHDITKGFYKYFFDLSPLRIKPFLLVNFTNRVYLRLVMMSIDKRNISLTKRVNPEIRIVNCKAFGDYISSLPI